MSSNKKTKILTGAVAAIGVASIVVPAGIASATISSNKSESVSNNENVKESSNEIAKDSSNEVIKISSNKPEIPYFYYWTNLDNTYLSWDYGHLANRPDKIEAIIDSNSDFSNPNYIEVKPKGAEFLSNISGDFYLRVRFFDSFGNVTHESVRKVIRNATETREVKGLGYEVSGTGIKISWAKFVDGIKSVEIYVNDKLQNTLSPSDVKNDSYVLHNAPDKSEVRIKIINGNDLEYNGVIFVDKSNVESQNLNLGVSKDGAGINVDLSKTGFKVGNKFSVNVVQKDNNEVIVNNSEYTLEQDKGSFVIFPDADKMFLNEDYVVTINDLKTGDVYSYDYKHVVNSISDFASVGLANGHVLASWKDNQAASSNLIWSATADFKKYESIEIAKGNTGVSFDTKLTGKNKIYLMLVTFDEKGRMISQDFGSVSIGEAQGTLTNFKGVFKSQDTAEFTWDKINTNVTKGILKINDKFVSLSKLEVDNLNKTNSLIINQFKKGSKHDISLYLMDDAGKVYVGNTSSIQSNENNSGEVTIEGVSGLYGRYNVGSGVLTLVLDDSIYNVKKDSAISILVNGKEVDSVSAQYITTNGTINITGLIPTKEYKDIKIGYKDEDGTDKFITISSILINKGSNLDSFLVNAYNKALSREISSIDEQGYNYWRKGLVSKKIGLSYFIRNLAFVPEFMNLANTPDQLITRLYNILIMRNPEPQGLQFWKKVYDELVSKGVSHEQATMKILTDMTTSNEFTNLAERLSVNP